MPARRLRCAHVVLRCASGLGAALALGGCVVATPADAGTPHERATATPGRVADGTYTGTGTYETPGGPQRIDVTVTLVGGVVEDVRVDPAARNTTSLRFQERFASAVVEQVVGRPLDDVAVDRLAGSSSTGRGFTAALEQAVHGAP